MVEIGLLFINAAQKNTDRTLLIQLFPK